MASTVQLVTCFFISLVIYIFELSLFEFPIKNVCKEQREILTLITTPICLTCLVLFDRPWSLGSLGGRSNNNDVLLINYFLSNYFFDN